MLVRHCEPSSKKGRGNLIYMQSHNIMITLFNETAQQSHTCIM